jgi:broad specificity phosphatase PhoE
MEDRIMAADADSVTHLGLLRHAETESNKNRWILGRYNSPLTEEDKNQAKEWGRILTHFHWDRIMTSDQGCSHETASLVNLSLDIPLISDPRLQDQDWGKWTGKTLEQILKENPSRMEEQGKARREFRPPGGEELNAVLERALLVLKEAHKQYSGETILVVIHEGVIRSIIKHLLENIGPDEGKSRSVIYLSNQLHRVFCYKDSIGLEAMNVLPLPYT